VPPAIQKKFPICTIRSTPDRPVHVVVWAKEFHKLLFGDTKSSYLYEQETGNGDSKNEEQAEDSVYMSLVRNAPINSNENSVLQWARQLFDAIFGIEIQKSLTMAPEKYKTAKAMPHPLYLADIESKNAMNSSLKSTNESTNLLKDQRVLSIQESAQLFLTSIVRFYTDPEICTTIGNIEFSKDSPLDTDFVTACCNLRAAIFSIPLQSRFDVQSIAGNIIPAIATTNAIVAGLQVLEAIKFIRGDSIAKTGCATYLNTSLTGRNKILYANVLPKPNPKCYVCGSQLMTLFIDTHVTTLKELQDNVLKGHLGFHAPNIDNNESFMFLEERDEEDDDEEHAQKLSLLEKPLSQLIGGGIHDGTTLSITDFLQDLKTSILIAHRNKSDFNELKFPQFFELISDAISSKPKETIPSIGTKRKREEDDNPLISATTAKKSQVETTNNGDNDDDIVIL
jgi:ubiquitin-like 1-activating enzyme E1 B